MIRGGGNNTEQCNVSQTLTTFNQFLYQCDVLRDVEKTKDHANDKSKSHRSHSIDNLRWEVGGRQDKMVC